MFSVQRLPPLVENIPGMANAIPGRHQKCSASRRNGVHHHPGMAFGINPESCSASSRNRVRDRPDSPNRLRQLKAERDASKVEAALNALTGCARTGQGNLLDLSIQAARAKATVGEISYALEKVFGRHKDEQKLVSGVYVKTFGEKKQPILAVEEKVAQFVKRTGHVRSNLYRPVISTCTAPREGVC